MTGLPSFELTYVSGKSFKSYTTQLYANNQKRKDDPLRQLLRNNFREKGDDSTDSTSEDFSDLPTPSRSNLPTRNFVGDSRTPR